MAWKIKSNQDYEVFCEDHKIKNLQAGMLQITKIVKLFGVER